MSFYIYRVTNKVNGKIYIGKTNNCDKRLKDHISQALRKSKCNYFQYAILKYGKDNFIIDVLEKNESEKETFELEKKWIKILKSNHKDIGYNLTEGGEGSSGYTHSDEWKNNMSLKMTGKIRSKNYCFNIAKAKLGKNNGMFERTHSNETKQKMSEFQKNRIRRKLTEEEKNIISQKVKAVGKQPRISVETKNNVKQLYASGQFSKRQLSENLGLKYNTVVKILRK